MIKPNFFMKPEYLTRLIVFIVVTIKINPTTGIALYFIPSSIPAAIRAQRPSLIYPLLRYLRVNRTDAEQKVNMALSTYSVVIWEYITGEKHIKAGAKLASFRVNPSSLAMA